LILVTPSQVRRACEIVNRQSAIVNVLPALAKNLVKGDPRGNAHVVRAHIPTYRQGNKKIAFLLHKSVQSAPLVTEDQCRGRREVNFPDWLTGFGGQACYPESLFLYKIQKLSKVCDTSQPDVRGRPRAGFDNRGAQASTAMLGKENAVGSCRFRRAQDGAEVMRVLDSIQQNQEPGGFCLLQDFLGGKRDHLCGVAENTLMPFPLCFPVQPGSRFKRDPDVALPGLLDYLLNTGIFLTPLNTNPLDFFGARPKRFGNRINSVQYRHSGKKCRRKPVLFRGH
jgi:hypothetical protein